MQQNTQIQEVNTILKRTIISYSIDTSKNVVKKFL